MRTFRVIQMLLLSALIFSPRVFSSDAVSSLVINELYYDHPGIDSGWEFIEIMNVGDLETDLSGCCLEAVDGRTGSSRILWACPEGLTLRKDGILLIAGGCRSVPDGLILQDDIENGPDGVVLSRSGLVIDRIGYGDLEIEGICESIPAPDVKDGFSLSRRPDGYDTDVNGNDLVESVPTPGMRNWYGFDIEIGLYDDSIILCNNNMKNINISIKNVGLNTFLDDIFLQIICRCIPVTYRFPVSVDLLAGASESCDIGLVFSGLRYGEAELVASAGIDENPQNDTCTVMLVESPSDLVINEIMYRPDPGRSEWIEVYNRSDREIDISGWTIVDAAGNEGYIGAGAVEGSGYLIIADEGGPFIEEFPELTAGLVDMAGGLPALNDRDNGEIAESIELRDGEGHLIERVVYSDLSGDERGRSIERVSPEICSCSDDGIWHRCSLFSGASPGEENSVYSPPGSSLSRLSVSPNPFDPAEDHYLQITGRCRGSETGFSVLVFDLRGIPVRRVFSERNGARRVSCRWDGRSDDNRRLAAGLYVCVAEFTSRGGSVCRREKVCVVITGSGR